MAGPNVTRRQNPNQLYQGAGFAAPSWYGAGLGGPGAPGGQIGSGSPYHTGMMPGRTQNISQKTVVNPAAGQAPALTDKDALIQAMLGQELSQQGARQSRLGSGLMGTTHNTTRNTIAGALSGFLGDRATKKGRQAKADALTIQAKADEAAKEAAELEKKALIDKQARATAQSVLANGGTQKQADAAYEMVKAELSPADVSGGTEPPDVSDYNSLQTQIEKVVGKDFMERTQAIRDIATYAQQGTGFSDHALIFRYMKFLDPGSTVREGEFATVENTGSVPERVRVQYNKALGGDKLSDDQRQNIVGAVTAAYPAYVDEYEKRMQPFKDRAEKFNMDWELVSVPEPYPMSDVQAAKTEEEAEPGVPPAPPPGYKMIERDGQWIAVPE